jgi:putative NADH-flavin reductase
MKILLIGGTGGTGRELIKQAIEQGNVVTALVQNPKKVKFVHQNLHLIKGNILDIDTVQMAVEEQDAVISVLGHKRFFIKTSILSAGTKNIINAMEMHNVKRFICITSLGINDGRFKLGLYYTLFVIPFIIFFYFKDKEKQEKLIVGSKLDWTIVRPGHLTNGKKHGKYKHGVNLGNYILTKTISRADVASFILSQLSDNTYLRKTVAIIN